MLRYYLPSSAGCTYSIMLPFAESVATSRLNKITGHIGSPSRPCSNTEKCWENLVFFSPLLAFCLLSGFPGTVTSIKHAKLESSCMLTLYVHMKWYCAKGFGHFCRRHHSVVPLLFFLMTSSFDRALIFTGLYSKMHKLICRI